MSTDDDIDASAVTPEDALRCSLLTLSGFVQRGVRFEFSEFACGIMAHRPTLEGYVHALVEWQPFSLPNYRARVIARDELGSESVLDTTSDDAARLIQVAAAAYLLGEELLAYERRDDERDE